MGHNRPENQISLRLAAPEKTGKSGMGHVAHDQCDNFDGPDGIFTNNFVKPGYDIFCQYQKWDV